MHYLITHRFIYKSSILAMGRKIAALFAIVGLINLNNCAAPRVSLDITPQTYIAEDYEDVYDTWTRDEKDFSFAKLTDILKVTATFESWDFRWAYITRYATDLGLTIQERDELLKASLADAKQFHRFYVTMTIHGNARETDLTHSSSAWRVLLIDPQNQYCTPATIQRINRSSAKERTYFPSFSPFRKAFRISFPAVRPDGTPTISDNAKHVTLRFTGPLGMVNLRWELQPPKTHH